MHPGRRPLDRSPGFRAAEAHIAATLSQRIPRPPAPEGGWVSYTQKLRDVRWKRRRDDLLRQRNYTCCKCAQPLTSGTMDLQVHHVVYIPGLAPWDYPDELLLIVCPSYHRERAALEQAIYVEVGKHLATLAIPELQRQPVDAFFEGDPLLAYPLTRRMVNNNRRMLPSCCHGGPPDPTLKMSAQPKEGICHNRTSQQCHPRWNGLLERAGVREGWLVSQGFGRWAAPVVLRTVF